MSREEVKFRVPFWRGTSSTVQVYMTFGRANLESIEDNASRLRDAARGLSHDTSEPYVEACGHLVRLAVDALSVENTVIDGLKLAK